MLHYTGMFIRLAGHDDAAYPHVLHVLIAPVQLSWKHVSVPWKHACLTA
jgi:hypothetical protein